MRKLPLILLAGAVLAFAAFTVACSDEDDDPTPTATQAQTTTATTATSASETTTSTSEETSTSSTSDSTGADGVPEAPSDVALEGALPDLNTPVPPGEGEQGRLTISWTDNSDDETGFRVIQECDGAQSPLIEVGADETSYGPLQTCRPGRLGVEAFNDAGESEIAWAP